MQLISKNIKSKSRTALVLEQQQLANTAVAMGGNIFVMYIGSLLTATACLSVYCVVRQLLEVIGHREADVDGHTSPQGNRAVRYVQ